MSIKLSTGMRNHLLTTGSFAGALNGGLLTIYSGPIPDSADDVLSGNTLLCTVSVDGLGGGINFEAAAVSGVLSKASAEVWQGTNAATGVASFYRWVEASGDPTLSSTTEKRIQGSIGVAGEDLNLSSVSLTSGAVQSIDFFNITLPASA